MMDRDLAIAQLRALVQVPGALRIITNEMRDEYKDFDHLRRLGLDPEALRSSEDIELRRMYHRAPPKPGTNLKDWRVMVVHDVVALEGPDDRGRMTARSAEGDRTVGYPEDLLARLTETGR